MAYHPCRTGDRGGCGLEWDNQASGLGFYGYKPGLDNSAQCPAHACLQTTTPAACLGIKLQLLADLPALTGRRKQGEQYCLSSSSDRAVVAEKLFHNCHASVETSRFTWQGEHPGVKPPRPTPHPSPGLATSKCRLCSVRQQYVRLMNTTRDLSLDEYSSAHRPSIRVGVWVGSDVRRYASPSSPLHRESNFYSPCSDSRSLAGV